MVAHGGFLQDRVCKSSMGKSELLSTSTASTEASLSADSSHGSQTPPKDRSALGVLEASAVKCEQPPLHKRTRRSNRRKHNTAEGNIMAVDSKEHTSAEERAVTDREVVTLSDLCFDFGPSLLGDGGGSCKTTPIVVPDKIMEQCVTTPVSPCRTRSGPSGIMSTNLCNDFAPTVGPASTRIPDATRSRFSSPSQVAPATLDLGLCAAAPEMTLSLPEYLLGSPCRGRTSPMPASMGVVSATPCNTPTCIVSATPCNTPTGIVTATQCNTPTGLVSAAPRSTLAGFVSTPCGTKLADASARTTDASARTPLAVRGAPLRSTVAASAHVPTVDAFTLGIERGPFSPCRPRVLFPSAVGHLVPERSELDVHAADTNSDVCASVPGGMVMADAMHSWLQNSGLPSGSAALEAELRAAVPEAYED